MTYKQTTVVCPADNTKQVVYCYDLFGKYICNGCENSNGSKECNQCKAAVQDKLNQTKSDNVP